MITRILDHYDKNIAGLMVWFDSDKNEYRRLVLPFSKSQPILLLAILAISSQHLAVTQGEASSFSGRARDAAVALISEQIHQVTERLASGCDLGLEIDTETAECLLASMLTLANYEMAESEAGATAADSHRHAARILVNALATTNRQNNKLFNFLRNQLSIYDILASTTVFGPTRICDVILPEVNPATAIFSDFLDLLHKVTLLSRGYDSTPSSDLTRLFNSPASARNLFELARGSTLIIFGSMELQYNQRRRDFIRLVDIYHHAALLYTYRLLFKGVVEESYVRASTTALFDQVNRLEDRSFCIQHLPWPMFIAGTECIDEPLRQAFVRRMYKVIAQDMGFRHYFEVLRFLEEFWSSGRSEWSELAQEYHMRGRSILPV